jgi:hypothetical protein
MKRKFRGTSSCSSKDLRKQVDRREGAPAPDIMTQLFGLAPRVTLNRRSSSIACETGRSVIVLVGAQRIVRSRSHYSVDWTTIVTGTR